MSPDPKVSKVTAQCGRFIDREPSPSFVARRWGRLPPVECGVWPHIVPGRLSCAEDSFF
jgi:hypothetical protein